MITINMHSAVHASVGGADLYAAWIDVADTEGSRITIFVDPKDVPAAQAMAEYFNEFVARNRHQSKVEPDLDFDDIL